MDGLRLGGVVGELGELKGVGQACLVGEVDADAVLPVPGGEGPGGLDAELVELLLAVAEPEIDGAVLRVDVGEATELGSLPAQAQVAAVVQGSVGQCVLSLDAVDTDVVPPGRLLEK